jgi:hypothetical protein
VSRLHHRTDDRVLRCRDDLRQLLEERLEEDRREDLGELVKSDKLLRKAAAVALLASLVSVRLGRVD